MEVCHPQNAFQPVRPDLAKFRRLGKIIEVFEKILIVFGKILNLFGIIRNVLLWPFLL